MKKLLIDCNKVRRSKRFKLKYNMILYWKEKIDVIGKDERGNNIYSLKEMSGEVVGIYSTKNSGYPKILLTKPDGKFTEKYSYDCYHKQ